MAALDTMKLDAFPWPKELIEGVKKEVVKHLWKWLEENGDHKLFERKVLGLFAVRIYVRDCMGLATLLLGPKPQVT